MWTFSRVFWTRVNLNSRCTGLSHGYFTNHLDSAERPTLPASQELQTVSRKDLDEVQVYQT